MSDDPFHSELTPRPTTESGNGVGPHHDDAAVAVATGTTDALADQPAEDALSVAEPTTDDDAASPDFLARLADAMRQTADAERSRVGEDIDKRRAEHLAAIQARRESETSRMRDLAAGDRKAIDAWADEERQRIQKERDTRLAAVEADLATSLEEHGKSVDAEIERIESAIAAHRTEVDAFFASFGTERDPVRIAQLAGQRPAFPELETVQAAEGPAESATAEAAQTASEDTVAESDATTVASGEDESSESTAAAETESEAQPGVAVMDPIARLGLGGDDLEHVQEPARSGRLLAGAWRPALGERPNQDRSDVPVASSSGGGNPISWLRRRDDSGDR